MAKNSKKPKRVRVNFDMDRSEYEEFREICEAADTTASMAMRALMRGFIKSRARENFSSTIVYEKGMEKLGEPKLPEVIEADQESNVA